MGRRPTRRVDFDGIPWEWREEIHRLARRVHLLSDEKYDAKRLRHGVTPKTSELVRLLLEAQLRGIMEDIADYQARFRQRYDYTVKYAIRQAGKVVDDMSHFNDLINLVEWDSRWLGDPRMRPAVRAVEQRYKRGSQVRYLHMRAIRNRHLQLPRGRLAKRLREGFELIPYRRFVYTKTEAARLEKLFVEVLGQHVKLPMTYNELANDSILKGLLPEDKYEHPSDLRKLVIRARQGLPSRTTWPRRSRNRA